MSFSLFPRIPVIPMPKPGSPPDSAETDVGLFNRFHKVLHRGDNLALNDASVRTLWSLAIAARKTADSDKAAKSAQRKAFLERAKSFGIVDDHSAVEALAIVAGRDASKQLTIRR
jgi:hypothetical protein